MGISTEEINAFIDKQINRRQSNKVLHSHPSPLLYNEFDLPVREILQKKKEDCADIPKLINIYLSIPFCLKTNPDSCGFCLFPHENYSGPEELSRYLKYLGREARMYRDIIDGYELASVYIGGGTPNICKAELYPQIINIVREAFPVLPEGLEITFEGVPQLFTREKLVKLKEVGVNRISIGVQQLSDELIRMSGRNQTAAQVFQVLEWCDELNLRTSVDLIYGWPRQTVENMLSDFKAIVEAGVSHITHYELNVAGRTDFASRKDELPGIKQNLEMFHASKEYLESHGYYQATTYDWKKSDANIESRLDFEDNMRQPTYYTEKQGLTTSEMLGLGYSGVSIFQGLPKSLGCVYINTRNLNDYYELIDKRSLPVQRGFRYSDEDIQIGCLFQYLQNIRISRSAYKGVFDVDLYEKYKAIWDVLVEKNWVKISSDIIELFGDGIYFTPLIQGLFSLERSNEIREINRLL